MKKRFAFIIVTMSLTSFVYAIGQIDIAYSPFTISQPGSYIVVKDLITPPSVNCITIQTSNVIIDLNGHTLNGPGTTAGTGGSGIVNSAVVDHITIFNGNITNFNGGAISLGGAQVHISKVKATGFSSTGIYIDGGVIENCVVSNTFFNGILCANSLYPGVITNNECDYNNLSFSSTLTNYPVIYVSNNCDVKGNNIYNNNAVGIYAVGDNNKITENTLNNNLSYGIVVHQNSSVSGNNVTGTNGTGVYCTNGCNVFGNTVSANSTNGIYMNGSGSRASGNEVYNNGNTGIYANQGCMLIDNSVYGNSSIGIDVVYGSTIRGNNVRLNGIIGISANAGNRIEGNNLDLDYIGVRVIGNANTIQNNSMFTNSTGLSIITSGNFFSGNVLRGNGVATTIAAGNTAGNGNTGFTNIVVPHSQTNFLIEYYAGFDLPVLRESQQAVIRNLRW